MAAQGLSRGRTNQEISQHEKIIKTVQSISQLQVVDSVNVVRRAHYMPLFARLGEYNIETLDKVLATPRSPLTEYWAHEASVVSAELVPDLQVWQRRTWIDKSDNFSSEQHDLRNRYLNFFGEESWIECQRNQSSLGRRADRIQRTLGLELNDTKCVTESLFARAKILTLGRNTQFERRYALSPKTY